jgi:hypothetical protein
MARPKVKTVADAPLAGQLLKRRLEELGSTANLQQRGANTVPDVPRNSPSGRSNAEEIAARLKQIGDSREMRVTRYDPKSKKRVVSSATELVPNDRARAIFTLLTEGGDEGRRLVAETFNSLPDKQKKNILVAIADAFPNPRADVGFSPVAAEIVESITKGAPLSPERMRQAEEVAAVGDLPPGWSSTRGRSGAEATENIGYDDTASFNDEPSPLEGAAPGDVAYIQRGVRESKNVKPPETVRKGLEQSLPYLRGPKSSTEILDGVLDDSGLPIPIRVKESGTGSIGTQDYPSIGKGEKYEAAVQENADRVAAEVARRYGGAENFSAMMAEAVRSGDKETVQRLLGEMDEIRQRVERVPVPPKPYPVGDIYARNSERPERDINADFVEGLARGDVGSADRAWDMIRKGATNSLTPRGAGGFKTADEMESWERQVADVLLSSGFFPPERLPTGPAFDTFRQGIIDTLRSRYSGSPAQVPLDPNTKVIDSAGNPADLEDVRKGGAEEARIAADEEAARQSLEMGRKPKLPRAPKPRSQMESWERQEFDQSVRPVDQYPGYRGQETASFDDFGVPKFLGVPTASSPEELAQQVKDARRNWALYRLQSGKVVYRDPETGAMKAILLGSNTQPGKVAEIRELAPKGSTPEDLARFEANWPEGGMPLPQYFRDIVSRADGIDLSGAGYSPLLDLDNRQLAGVLADPEQADNHEDAIRILSARSAKADSKESLQDLSSALATVDESAHPAIAVARKRTSDALAGNVMAKAEAQFNRGTFSPDAKPESINRMDEFDDQQLQLAREEWKRVTGKDISVPPGFIQRPDGKVVATMFAFDPTFAHKEWAKVGGPLYGRSDVPYTRDNPPKKIVRDESPVEDPGYGEGIPVEDDSPVVRNAPETAADATPDDDHASIVARAVKIISDHNSSNEDLEWARQQWVNARTAYDSIKSPEAKAEFKRTIIDPMGQAAQARKAGKPPASEPTNVSDNLDASSTPIEEPSVTRQTPDQKANENADAQKSASDAEGLDGVDVDESPDGVTPNGTLIKRAAKPDPKDPRWFPRTRDHLWGNKGKYAIGAATSGIGLYAATPGNPPYIPGSEPFSFGAEGPGQAVTPEDRIRQAIKLRMEQELIPHTSQRYY